MKTKHFSANRIDRRGRRLRVAGIAAALLLAAAGGKFGFDRLRSICLEECVIRDMAAQVTIKSGKMVHPDTIADKLGLKNGVNLATKDFAALRDDILKDIPNLRDIQFVRRLPDRLYVTAEERTPIARMGVRGKRRTTGRVADAEGMVFICQRGTQSLPVIYEPQEPWTQPGKRIAARTLAALRLIEACRAPEFLELGVLDVDVSKPDFLLATLGNYSKLKICWERMDDAEHFSKSDLEARLRRLRDAIRSKITPDTVIWNATIPGEIFANTQEKL